jgi:hypothetical protein
MKRLAMFGRLTAVTFVAAMLILVVTWMTYGAVVNAYAFSFPRVPDSGRGMVIAFQAKSATVYIDRFEALFIAGLKWGGIAAGGVAAASVVLRGRMPRRSELQWLNVSDVQVCFSVLACVIALSIIGTAW